MKHSRSVVAVLSAACLVLIAVTSVNSSFLKPLRDGAGYLLVPLERGVNAVGSGIYVSYKDYSTLREAQKDNEQLTERVSALTEENNRLASQVQELARLRELYQLDQDYQDYPKVAARVIAKDSGSWFQVFRINKGSADGIQPDMNVMAGGGLIGIITDVGTNYATVRSIIDDDSNVSGMSQRTGETCNVSGSMELYENGRLGLDHIRKEADITDGDKIVTSNISDVYLPGILIGYAAGLQTDANNVTKSGTIVPVAQFDNLQEVLIITKLKNEPDGSSQQDAAGEASTQASDHNDTPQEESSSGDTAGESAGEETSAAGQETP